MKVVDYLIVGQGIAGTFLSWYLLKAGKSVLVIDNNESFTASRVAAGIINPVTGRRIVKTWMIDELMPFAKFAYEELGDDLEEEFISKKSLIDFFPSPQMLLAFRERVQEEGDYLSIGDEENRFSDAFNYAFGYGIVDPCYAVDLPALLSRYRTSLDNRGLLIEEEFDPGVVRVLPDSIEWADVKASHLIFCDGIGSARNPWFSILPFAWNKGEALLVKCKELAPDYLFKKGLIMSPMAANYFWVGSSYEWNFHDPYPSEAFKERTLAQLSQWLKVPFVLEAHLASIRPATVERRPFVGLHPTQSRIGILNGMGTKGCSLAPYFAKQLADHFTKNTPIFPEVNVQRFSRLLNRT
jgi:glycine/D-amino acid oxidase-like deaminating enzyme